MRPGIRSATRAHGAVAASVEPGGLAASRGPERHDLRCVHSDLEALPLLRSGQALITKTLAVYAPEHYIDVYSGDHLCRFITLFGGTPVPEAPSWVLNRQLLALVTQTSPFSGWTREETLQFLYQHLDPRPADLPILKIAPGEQARLWPDCLQRGLIRVGFDEVGDLSGSPDDDALADGLMGAHPERAPARCASSSASSCASAT